MSLISFPFDNDNFTDALKRQWKNKEFGIIKDLDGRSYWDMCVNSMGQVYTVWDNGMGKNHYAHIEGDRLIIHGHEYVAELKCCTPSGSSPTSGIISLAS